MKNDIADIDVKTIYWVSKQTMLEENPEFGICSMKTVVEFCNNHKVISLDIETTGLNFISDKMLLLAIGNENIQFVIDTTTIDIAPLKPFLEDDDRTFILANASFDYKFLKHKGITLARVYDVMLAEMVLNAGKRDDGFGLADIVFNRLGVTLNKSIRGSFISGNYQVQPHHIKYAADDIKHLGPLRTLQNVEAVKENLESVILLENRACLAFGDIEFNGLTINRDAWIKLSIKAREDIKVKKAILNEIIETDSLFDEFKLKDIQLDMFIPEDQLPRSDVKWSSPTQVLKIFQKVVPSLDSVNATELAAFEKKHKIISKYIDYKAQMKLATSYGENFLDNLYDDGKIHTSFRQILKTGRVSCSSPNMQQIPADNAYRNCFIPDDPDWVFVSADYASQELVLIAHTSQDPVWRKALETGEDLHSVCAELVFGAEWKAAAESDCDYYKGNDKQVSGELFLVQTYAKKKCHCKRHKELRDSVKTINFGLAYGMGPNKLAERLSITQGQATKLIDTYFKVFPNIKQALERSAQFGKMHGYIQTLSPWKRKRWFPGWRGGYTDQEYMASIERESKNTPIQGAGADMTKLALCMIRKFLNENPSPVKLVMTVHDQIDTICHKDLAIWWKDKLVEIMEIAAKHTVTSGLLKAEGNISNVWEK